jgi:deoxyribodipyrimidine photo-lyase
MVSKFKKSIFMFTRDLRLEDNTGLIYALINSEKVLPIFIFNPDQVTDKNKYKSNNCVQFMCESLESLDKDLRSKGSRLFYFYGKPNEIIGKLIKHEKIDAVICSLDYTPYAKKREQSISKVCADNKIDFLRFEDHMLTGCKKVLKDDNTPYVKFTPYYRESIKKPVNAPCKNKYDNYMNKTHKITFEYEKDIHKFYKVNNDIFVHGGRENAMKILENIKDYKDYNNTRDVPSKHTTGLSAYLKFNVVSIREVYEIFKKKLNNKNKLLVQLRWRDFYMSIIYHYPHSIGGPMKTNYYLKWDNDVKLFNKWKNGETGVPIVDAGMRQLNKIGWMHNRVRMIVSNYLIKILKIDWMWGEKYFAQMLVDYDPCNNNGGWQWGASTGTDSQPYFRIFNPWRQAENFDKNCEYIKEWIPELVDVPNKDILNWNTMYKNYKNIKYPVPIILDLKEEIKKTLTMYENRRDKPY